MKKFVLPVFGLFLAFLAVSVAVTPVNAGVFFSSSCDGSVEANLPLVRAACSTLATARATACAAREAAFTRRNARKALNGCSGVEARASASCSGSEPLERAFSSCSGN